MDESACNYGDGEGDCEYADDNYDCDGDCTAVTDCTGECGGQAAYDECGECDGDGIADDACDCVGNVLDECGECGGDGIADGACDCVGNVLDECGECGGDGIADGACDCVGNVLDECGECGGDGTSCLASLSLGAFDASGSLEVLYDFGGPVAGFQFDVTGLALTGGSGGAASDAGMTVSTGGTTVLGFFIFELRDFCRQWCSNCIIIQCGNR